MQAAFKKLLKSFLASQNNTLAVPERCPAEFAGDQAALEFLV